VQLGLAYTNSTETVSADGLDIIDSGRLIIDESDILAIELVRYSDRVAIRIVTGCRYLCRVAPCYIDIIHRENHRIAVIRKDFDAGMLGVSQFTIRDRDPEREDAALAFPGLPLTILIERRAKTPDERACRAYLRVRIKCRRRQTHKLSLVSEDGARYILSRYQ
jgi:hypothetical protein